MKLTRTMGMILAVAILVFQPSPLKSQTGFGTILGTVTDPSGATIAGATVTVINNQTKASRQVQSEAFGGYSVGSLLPATYTVKVEHAGFTSQEFPEVIVNVGQTVTLDCVLKVGAVTQTVEVTAAAPQLQTSNANVGQVVNNRDVVTLPLNGRSFTNLIALVPGTIAQGAEFTVGTSVLNYSVSGNRYEQNNFTLDGVYNSETMFKQFAIQPSIDALQEFKVETNVTSAQFGEAAGASVALVTKSGTNLIHGSAFEFVRNDLFDAADFFRNYANLPKPEYRRNQFGGVVGGPVYIPGHFDGRNKAFWMFNYEGSREIRGSSAVATVPTSTELGGNLQDLNVAIYDPATVTQVGTTYTASQMNCNGVLNVICSNRLDPAVAAYSTIFFPASTTGTVENTAPLNISQNQITTRGDVVNLRGGKINMFGRYSQSLGDQLTPQALPALSTTLWNHYYNAEYSVTALPSSNMVVDFRFGYLHTGILDTDSNPSPGAASFLDSYPLRGTPVKSAAFPLFPLLGIDGYTSPSQNAFPFFNGVYQYLLNVEKIKGRHTIKTGFDITHDSDYDDGLFTSIYTFTNIPTADPQNLSTTGAPLASYLLGLPSDGRRDLGNTAAHMRNTNWQFYVNDDIKLTRNFTFNLGLRYEYNQWPYAVDNRLAMFDNKAGTYIWAGTNPVTGQGANTRRSVRDPDFNNFAPRLGIAYRLTPKTTLRSGFGIYYSSDFIWEQQGVRGQWPYSLSESLTSTNTPLPNQPIETYFNSYTSVQPGTPPSAQFSLGRHDRTPYVQQWNFGIQRELAQNLMLEVDYVGNEGVKESVYVTANAATPGPGPVGSAQHPRPYSQVGTYYPLVDLGKSNYNALQVKIDKRFSNGLQFLASYAFSKYIDIGGSAFSQPSLPENENNIQADRAVGTYNHPNIFTGSWYYSLPFGPGRPYLSGSSGALAKIIGNWQITGIVSARSGDPVNVTIASDIANDGSLAPQRPDLSDPSAPRTVASLMSQDRTKGWLNPARYSFPASYTFGNSGRNTERGPSFANLDFGVLKDFPLGSSETRRLEFRAEFFNILNHTDFADPGVASATGGIGSGGTGTFGTATFGQIFSTVYDSREIQFALKLLF